MTTTTETTTTTKAAPHSALYLTDLRDLWWNADFLQLLATRTNLRDARRVLDVGAGLGHWTRTVARLLAPGAEVIGVDREREWVARAGAGGDVDGVALSFEHSDAHTLPFADDSFDVVTCQTLLIHVRDPRAVVTEMVRVLKPGGRLLLVEPNNLTTSTTRYVISPGFDLERVLSVFKLQALCERGKHALGLGYNTQGEGLVGLVDSALVDDVRVWNNDRCTVYVPGEARDRRAELQHERGAFERGEVPWPKDETRRYHDAGGGSADEFEALWSAAQAMYGAWLDGVEAGTISSNEGGLFYVLSARKR